MLNSEKKQLLSILSVGAVALILASTPLAFAAGAHFIGTPTIIKNSDFSITAKFKAAGLGDGPASASLSSSGGSADLQCVSKGGGTPIPKHATFGPFTQTQPIQPHNGQITASVTLGPPALPSASQLCPNGNWSVVIQSVTYQGVVLAIKDANGNTILSHNFGTVIVP